jgi:hypothetical protein
MVEKAGILTPFERAFWIVASPEVVPMKARATMLTYKSLLRRVDLWREYTRPWLPMTISLQLKQMPF